MARSRLEVEEGLRRYLDPHDTFREEAYQFDIKMRRIDIPPRVQEHVGDITINATVEAVMESRLSAFVEGMKARYDWIGNWAVAGRSSGWLVLESHDAMLDQDAELQPEDLPEARRRLRNLDEIDWHVRESKRELKRELGAVEFWRTAVPGRLPGRKGWDPRDTKMSGRKDWDPRKRRPGMIIPQIGEQITDYLDAYLEAALWSETDPETEEPLDKNYTTQDIAPDTMEKLISDAFDFMEKNYEDVGDRLKQAGHDFWLTRNGHGAGFWDGDWPEPEASRLTRSSKEFGEVTLVVGDDGKIHAL